MSLSDKISQENIMRKTIFFITLSLMLLFFIKVDFASAVFCEDVDALALDLSGGNYTPSGSCQFKWEVTGVENGNLIINDGVSITLQANQTLVWNPGSSITINGSLVMATGASLKKTYLWMEDADNDSYPTATTTYALDSTSTLPNGQRRKDMNGTNLEDVVVDGDDAINCGTGYSESASCATACKGCLNGACVDIPNEEQDSYGSHTCEESHYVCDGAGTCHAPISGYSCNDIYWMSASCNQLGCGAATSYCIYGSTNAECSVNSFACNTVAATQFCKCAIYQF